MINDLLPEEGVDIDELTSSYYIMDLSPSKKYGLIPFLIQMA